MKENPNVLSPNECKVMEVFARDCVDCDHYESGNEIYRYSAYKYCDLSGKTLKEAIVELLDNLNSIEIRPSRILIWGCNIEIDWTPKPYQVVTSRDEYLQLSLHFAQYLDKINIQDLKINTGSFLDDSYEIPEYDKEKIKYNPEFDKNCFGWDDEIEIIKMPGQELDINYKPQSK